MAKYKIDNENRTVAISKAAFKNLTEAGRQELSTLASFGYKVTVSEIDRSNAPEGDKRKKEDFLKALDGNPEAQKEFNRLCADKEKGFFAAASFAKKVLGEK